MKYLWIIPAVGWFACFYLGIKKGIGSVYLVACLIAMLDCLLKVLL